MILRWKSCINVAPSILPAVDDDVSAWVEDQEEVGEEGQHFTPAAAICFDRKSNYQFVEVIQKIDQIFWQHILMRQPIKSCFAEHLYQWHSWLVIANNLTTMAKGNFCHKWLWGQTQQHWRPLWEDCTRQRGWQGGQEGEQAFCLSFVGKPFPDWSAQDLPLISET